MELGYTGFDYHDTMTEQGPHYGDSEVQEYLQNPHLQHSFTQVCSTRWQASTKLDLIWRMR